MDHLNRRDFVRKAGLGAAGTGVLASCGSADTQSTAVEGEISGPRVSWRMATSFPPSLDILHGAALVVAARVEALTGHQQRVAEFLPAGPLDAGVRNAGAGMLRDGSVKVTVSRMRRGGGGGWEVEARQQQTQDQQSSGGKADGGGTHERLGSSVMRWPTWSSSASLPP